MKPPAIDQRDAKPDGAEQQEKPAAEADPAGLLHDRCHINLPGARPAKSVRVKPAAERRVLLELDGPPMDLADRAYWALKLGITSAGRVKVTIEVIDDSAGPPKPRCKCHWEEGDSPCPVHGDDSADLAAAKLKSEHYCCGKYLGYAPSCPECGRECTCHACDKDTALEAVLGELAAAKAECERVKGENRATYYRGFTDGRVASVVACEDAPVDSRNACIQAIGCIPVPVPR